MEVMPEPLSAIVVGEVAALFTSVMVPARFPVDAGVKAAEKEVDAPGAMERGKANPENENPVPETEACEMLRLAVPGF